MYIRSMQMQIQMQTSLTGQVRYFRQSLKHFLAHRQSRFRSLSLDPLSFCTIPIAMNSLYFQVQRTVCHLRADCVLLEN